VLSNHTRLQRAISPIIRAMPSLLSELRRRNVLRVAAAYALVAWIIIEAGSVLLPTFGATESTFQAYVIFVLIGFFVAVILAWILQITPDGVRRDSEVDPSTTPKYRPKILMNYAIIGLLAVALGVSITFNVTGIREPRPAVVEQAGDKPAIAVLPFASLSSDPDNALFTDGIHGDILTKLANIGSCKVISRTSVMEYRDTTKNMRQIGEELDVGTIVQGSVQRIGDNVRINVQLVDTQTDINLWAQTYDRQLTAQNIFAIQSEISEAIALQLETTLTPAEQVRITATPTEDLRAYSAYISGRDNVYLRRLETLLKAREYFEQAIAFDPNYAAAYAGLAESILLLQNNHQVLSQDEAHEIARANLEKALELDPELADAYAIRGLLESKAWSQTRVGNGNIVAEAAFRRAIELNPNHASAYMWFASLRDTELRNEEAIELYQRSMELDPLGRIPYTNLPTLYAQRGQNRQAIRLWLDAIEIHPEWPTPYRYLGTHLLGMGRFDEALAWNIKSATLSDDPTSDLLNMRIYLEFGESDRAIKIMEDLPENHPFSSLAEGFILLVDSDYRNALDFFSAAIASDNGSNALPFLLFMAAEVALLVDDLDKARQYTLMNQPILTADTELPIDQLTVAAVVRLAYIDQREGNKARARKLLQAALPVVRELPRLGMVGQGVLEVQILALLGREEDAFVALRELVDEGFRGSLTSNVWRLDEDPFLTLLRDDPRFTGVLDEISEAVEMMHDRVLQAERNGDWDSLRALAEII